MGLLALTRNNFSLEPLQPSISTIIVADNSFTVFEVIQKFSFINSAIFPAVYAEARLFIVLVVPLISI